MKCELSLDNEFFQNIKTFTFPLPEGASALPNLIRYILSAIYNIVILLLSKKEEILIYNFNNPLSLAILNKLNVFLRRKIIIFCHGELELLITKEGGGLAKLLRYFINSFFFSNKSLYLRFCVLGDVIIENLKPIIGEKIDYFFSIDHPYEFAKDDVQAKNQRLSLPLRMATIGTLNKFKGIDLFLELAKTVKKENLDVTLSVIGNVSNRKEELENLEVKIHGKGELLEREELDRAISNIDYILFFYSEDKYKITASGAIFDAIKWRKPIIAMKNDYFLYLFEKYGSIGFLCKDIHQMEQQIKQILENQNQYQYNFDRYISKLSTREFTEKIIKLIKLCY
ncbi:glycosyltransferase [Capnocytophaga stomatis]|uniref:glycosyltransferase n=1 Tax=Capnocytophaga stomatis TaxID=1848904 RepID=UPI00385C0055